jgi:capsular polysaccharide biosynthesis protein
LSDSELGSRGYTVSRSAEAESSESGGAADGEYVLSLRGPLQAIWKRLWIIALVAVVFAAAAVGFTLMQTPMYNASIKAFVGQDGEISGSLGENVLGLQQLTKSMAEAVNSRPVAQTVTQRLNLQMDPEDFLENLTVEQIPETQFISVSYQDPSPETAQQVVNTVGDVFSEQVSELNPSASGVTITVWEWAETPSTPVDRNIVLNGLLGFVLGLMLGTGLAIWLAARS